MAVKSKARHDLTLRSIKREIGAGRDVAYWLDKAYTHLDNGLLTEDDIAEPRMISLRLRSWPRRITMPWTSLKMMRITLTLIRLAPIRPRIPRPCRSNSA